MVHDDFGKRMKTYENSYRFTLPRRMPVILRIDGCHFHTFTKGMDKPFDDKLIEAFWETCKFLGENIMGAKLIYHQSDEISILITNYDTIQTDSWFSNNLQNMASVSASMAAAKFNEVIRKSYPDKELAFFDSRAWVIPQDEVNNYFTWRQQDASKNRITMAAFANFAHKDLHGLSGNQLQEKLFSEKGINWDKFPTWKKRGACIIKKEYLKENAIRRRWETDLDIPLFSKDRNYVERFVYL